MRTIILLAVATLLATHDAHSQMVRSTFSNAAGTREFAIVKPASLPAQREHRALVVMLHGCGQSADQMASATRMNAAGGASGFIALYPEQPASANPQRCWNWFVADQVSRERGETALLAALIDSVARSEGVPATRVSLVGMSAGAAMAVNLAVAYPERFAAVAAHSGVPALAAKEVFAALRVMKEGAGDGEALGAAAVAAMGTRARAIPLIALHGANDAIVSPNNLAALVRQWAIVNARTSTPVEQHMFAGVGHAWSGGAAEVAFTAPGGPDATKLIVDFLRRVGAIQPD